jgi:hypothetical protein
MTNSVLNQFIQEKSRPAGSIKLFKPQDAEKLVRLLISAGRKVHGVDGVFVNEEGHRPSMEDSISTSDLYNTGRPGKEIETKVCKFIEERASKKNLFFEVVF